MVWCVFVIQSSKSRGEWKRKSPFCKCAISQSVDSKMGSLSGRRHWCRYAVMCSFRFLLKSECITIHHRRTFIGLLWSCTCYISIKTSVCRNPVLVQSMLCSHRWKYIGADSRVCRWGLSVVYISGTVLHGQRYARRANLQIRESRYLQLLCSTIDRHSFVASGSSWNRDEARFVYRTNVFKIEYSVL